MKLNEPCAFIFTGCFVSISKKNYSKAEQICVQRKKWREEQLCLCAEHDLFLFWSAGSCGKKMCNAFFLPVCLFVACLLLEAFYFTRVRNCFHVFKQVMYRIVGPESVSRIDSGIDSGIGCGIGFGTGIGISSGIEIGSDIGINSEIRIGFETESVSAFS